MWMTKYIMVHILLEFYETINIIFWGIFSDTGKCSCFTLIEKNK